MSNSWSDNSIPRQLLTLGGLTVATSQLAWLSPWLASLGTFLVFTIPVGMFALSGNLRATLLLCIVASVLGSGVSWFVCSDFSVAAAVVSSAVGSACLTTLSLIIGTTSRRCERQIAGLEVHRTELARNLYDSERNSADSSACIPVAFAATSESFGDPDLNDKLAGTRIAGDRSLADRDFFDFAMLLLSMQDIGQRLSSDLDLRSLVPTILSMAKEVLRCQRTALFYWNSRASRLTDALSGTALPSTSGTWPSTEVLEWVIAQRRLLTRRDVASGRLLSPAPSSELVPAAVAPLLVGEELIGLLVVDGVKDDNATFVRLLYIFANHCALGVKNAQLFRHIEEMARRDSLTGLLNHASFLDELERLTEDARTSGKPLTIVMSDIDHFKHCNDTYGHQAGDRVLQEVVRCWRAIMPDHAVLGRYGGEEFIGALPGESLDRGSELAELVRSEMEAHPVRVSADQLRVTASFGVAEFGCPASTTNRLVRLADKALFRAKASGRNCVVCHEVLLADDLPFGKSTIGFVLDHSALST